MPSMADAGSLDQLLPPRVTLEEWIALAEDAPGEFIDGRLVRGGSAGLRPRGPRGLAGPCARNWAEHTDAIVGASDAKFKLSATRGRKADLTMYFGGRRPPSRGVIAVPPDVAVEIVSSSPRDERRDRVEKIEEYARIGIRFYWLIDPQQRTVDSYEQAGDRGYVRRVQASTGSIQEVPGCPGLTLDLDAMWRKIDALEEP